MASKLWYIHTTGELVEILVALGNPEGLASMVAVEFFLTHEAGTAYEWEDLKAEIAKAANSVVSKAAQIALKQGKVEIGVDEDGDFVIM